MKFPKFNSRPAHTLLLVGDEKSWRVDCDNKGIFFDEITSFETGCKKNSQLNKFIENISDPDHKFGRKVWVLFSRLPVHIISLPTMQVRGVDDENLTHILQFELESLTGQPALDSLLAYQHLGSQHDMSDFRVSSIEQLDFEDLVSALKKAGSHLGGLLHPAGLAHCIEQPDTEKWHRIESWPTQIFSTRNHPDDGFSVQIYSTEHASWHANLEQEITQKEAPDFTESLLNFNFDVLPDTDVTLDLNSNETTEKFLSAWAVSLINSESYDIPVLTAHSKTDKNLLIMVGGGVGALLLCSLHFGWHTYQTNFYENELADLKNLQKSMEGMRKNITALKDTRNQLKTKQKAIESDATTIPTLLDALQKRPSHLLHALAVGSNDELIIQSIDSHDDQVVISGVTLKASHANKLASLLMEKLSDLGWQVSSPEKINMSGTNNDGPWSFSLNLTDLGVSGFTQTTGDN